MALIRGADVAGCDGIVDGVFIEDQGLGGLSDRTSF